MEAIRDENPAFRIATEGLRLVKDCKEPKFDCSEITIQTQQRREWWQRVSPKLCLLVDWIDQHRFVLLHEERPTAPVKEFRKYFLLVFMEQLIGNSDVQRMLMTFFNDVRTIFATSSDIRDWLLHYYGTTLGQQHWICRTGDLYSFVAMFCCLGQADITFGQKMISFAEKIGKELLGHPQHVDHKIAGILVLGAVIKIYHRKRTYIHDAKKILNSALSVDRDVGNTFGDTLWGLVYYCITSIRASNLSLDGEDVLHLLPHLDEAVVKKLEDRTFEMGKWPLVYLKTVTLLLLLDVPGIKVEDFTFDVLTIGDLECDWETLLQHMKSSLQTSNSRVSIDIRLRIGKMIPKLFYGFTARTRVNAEAYKCLHLLILLTMFPVSQTRQQMNARGMMLKRLLEEMMRLCADLIENRSEYPYEEDDWRGLYDNVRSLVFVVREGAGQLPSTGWFRRWKRFMQEITKSILDELEIFLIEVLDLR